MYIRTSHFLCLLVATPCPASPVSTLEEAIQRTTKDNPLLRSYEHRIAASKGSVKQAGLLPNPELEVEIEEFGGDRDGFNETESTIALSQPLELGGKRGARIAVASTEAELAKLEAEVLKREILGLTEVAFARAQKAQAVRAALKEQIKLSQKVLETAEKKLEAGAILRVEKTKALIALQNDKVALQVAENELLSAKLALASLWQGTSSDIGTLSAATLPPNIKEELTDSPQMRLINAKHELTAKKFKLEKARAIPNVNVGLGYKRFQNTNDETYLGTLSMELPLFNRNQGSIARAREGVRIGELSKENQLTRLRTSFDMLRIKLKQSFKQYQALEGEILPSAKQAFKEANEAYRQGRSSYLELLDAQETLFESTLKKEELLFQIAETSAKLNKFTGATK